MVEPDRQRYEGWVGEHASGLFRLAYRLTGERDLAEDLVQETFVEAWKCRATLADMAKAKAWLCQILRHRWMRYLRDKSRRIRTTSGLEGIMEQEGGREGGDPARKLAESDALQRALDTMETDMKLPLLLVAMEGYTCQEVANMLGVPLGTVLSRVHRAKQAMREQLGSDYMSGGPEIPTK